jgi:hypothetical protein
LSAPVGLGRLASAIALAICLSFAALAATAARGEGWRSAQPPLPPAPEEEPSVGVPAPLGHIGQISFWAPNHGLLITAGNETIEPGLYYYDGTAWQQLATVCGGTEGRIAWAGPDDFWTISDQQAGQLGLGISEDGFERRDRSLCHFAVGASGKLEVIASYAEPLGVAGSYQPMDAAACSGPDNCWFGGERLPAGINSGAFHLHWNGSALTPMPSLEAPEPQLEDPAHDVTGLVFYKGRFYESVKIEPGEPPGPGEISQPHYLHKIVEGSSNPFVPLGLEGPPAESPRQPDERERFAYTGPGAFRFSAGASELWAISGAGPPTLLLLGASNQFQQVRLGTLEGEVAGIAAEPGSEDAWVSLDSPSEHGAQAVTRVARLEADGAVEGEARLPEAHEQMAHKGPAGAVACSAPGDCWVASESGWLFHLGGTQPEDDDPAFQTLIAHRPKDDSIPFAAAEESFPEDDSGARVAPQLPADLEVPPSPVAPRAHKPLFSNVSSRLLHRTTLALTFTLATKSHVRLLALRRGHPVAATGRKVLAGGRHTLRLRLSPRAWPTKLDLRVKAIGAVPLQPSGGGPTGGPTVIGTSLSRPATAGRAGPFASKLWPAPLT